MTMGRVVSIKSLHVLGPCSFSFPLSPAPCGLIHGGCNMCVCGGGEGIGEESPHCSMVHCRLDYSGGGDTVGAGRSGTARCRCCVASEGQRQEAQRW